MDKIEKFKNGCRIVGAAATGAVAKALGDFLDKKIPSEPTLTLVGMVICFAGISLVLEVLISKLADWRIVRQYLIFRKSWIEGTYIDVVVDMDKRVIYGSGIVDIGFVDGKLHIEGWSLSASGEPEGVFESDVVDCRQRRVHFIYHFRGTIYGYAEYEFFAIGDREPTEFSGWFIDSQTRNVHHVSGFKISDKALLGELVNPQTRKSAVTSYLEDLASSKGYRVVSTGRGAYVKDRENGEKTANSMQKMDGKLDE